MKRTVVVSNTKKIKKRHSKNHLDPVSLVKYGDLIYVTTATKGIRRIKRGKGFYYLNPNGKVCTDKKVVRRIIRLVLPPAWKDVWISPLENGHLQAIGIDSKGRKQYRYHSEWNRVTNVAKFFHMSNFGQMLPQIREQVKKDLALPGLPQRKVLALIVRLMERTFIRIGNNEYEKLYGSYGLTTMKDKHVQISGNDLRFSFKGKKGIYHEIKLHSKRLALLVKKCRDIKGQELFQYYDEEGKRHPVDSGMVNTYLKEISQNDFTAKDFRTWAGTVNAVHAFDELGKFATESELKHNLVQVFDKVSQLLGNTRSICKKYYVHPLIVEQYEKGLLIDYLSEIKNAENGQSNDSLSSEEKVVLKILKNTGFKALIKTSA
jgi:DNA topoisomerase I